MNRPFAALSAALLGAMCLTAMPRTLAAEPQTSTAEDRRHGRRNFNVPPGQYYSGRSPFTRAETAAAPAQPSQAPAEALGDCQTIDTGWVHMTKTMPREVVLGQEFMVELNARAVDCVGNVVITDQIPAGATYVRSEPKAEVVGNTLVWRVGDMDPGQTLPIRVWLRADREGEIGSCATVRADPRLCAKTLVGKPQLVIEKSGPEIAQLNSDITYTIVVANRGSAIAKNVVVTDDIPDGLKHATGQKTLTFNVGDLAPNQSKSLPVTVKAAQRGKFCNASSATGTGIAKVSDDACTTVVQPGLKIVKTGEKQQLINKNAKYQIVVSNIGDTELSGVTVTDTAPAPTTIVAAPGATISGNTATWNVGALAKGAEKTFEITLTSKEPGNYCNGAQVATAQGLRESAQACTEWIGVTGVLVEVVDDPDPIQIDEFTTYTLRVTNQGSSRNIRDLVIKAMFPEETTPASASNGGTVSGKSVSWPTVPTLAPKQSITYTIRAKGTKAGDSRMHVEVTTAERTNPITEMESTTVY